MATVPDPELAQVIESYSVRFRDPVDRLKFLRTCARVAEDETPLLGQRRLGRLGYRLIVLDSVRRSHGLRNVPIPIHDRVFLVMFRAWRAAARYVPVAAAATALVLLILGSFMTLREPSADADTTGPRPVSSGLTPAAHAALGGESSVVPPPLEVWLVETKDDSDLYSNGLRILNEYSNHSEPRSFAVYSRGSDGMPESPQKRTKPVGIVYHTTVSEIMPPLERANNQLIRYRGARLLSYISRENLYNFVIDRFGRVYRTVPEGEFSHHAGYSIWSEGGELYFNLNQSFIAVAFETRPEALDPNAPPQESITQAQITSARLLTEVLRDKFGIANGNCVTHEMVSVNPDNMLIGYHTDWKGRFPFQAVGLPDNYQRTLPSITDWGFDYDSLFKKELNGRLWPGVGDSMRQFEKEAAARDLAVERYRRAKQQNYKEFLARLREGTKDSPVKREPEREPVPQPARRPKSVDPETPTQ